MKITIPSLAYHPGQLRLIAEKKRFKVACMDRRFGKTLKEYMEVEGALLLAAALGDIARAKGMAEISQKSGLTREALYKALRPGAQPRFDTIQRVCGALGVRLKVEPAPRLDA